MNLFFDSSVLVKLFHEESGTAKATEWVDDTANIIWLLDLAKLEFTSALHRRFRGNEINEHEMNMALEAYYDIRFRLRYGWKVETSSGNCSKGYPFRS